MMFRLGLTMVAGLFVQQALSQGDPVLQQVSLMTTTQIGPHGAFCEPFDCKPHYTTAAQGEVVRFDIGGAPAEPFVLFAGTSVIGCQPVAGIGNALAVWAPITTVAIGLVNDATPLPGNPLAPPPGSQYPCNPGTAVVQMMVPLAVPAGMDIRFQVLALNNNPDVMRLEFSRAVELLIH